MLIVKVYIAINDIAIPTLLIQLYFSLKINKPISVDATTIPTLFIPISVEFVKKLYWVEWFSIAIKKYAEPKLAIPRIVPTKSVRMRSSSILSSFFDKTMK